MICKNQTSVQSFESLDDLGSFAKKARGCILTQGDIAKKSGWCQKNVSILEDGDGTISLNSTIEIFQALGYKFKTTLEKV